MTYLVEAWSGIRKATVSFPLRVLAPAAVAAAVLAEPELAALPP